MPDPLPRQRASLTAFRNFILVEPFAVLNAGGRVDPDARQPVLPPDAPPEALGAAARDGLGQSRWLPLDHPDHARVMRAPPDDNAYYAPLLKRAGVRSRRALHDGARRVALTLVDDLIAIQPMTAGRSGSWIGSGEHTRVILPASISDEALGAAIREGLARSR